MKPLHHPTRLGTLLLLALLACGMAGCKKQPFIEIVQQTPHLGLPADMQHIVSIDMSRLRANESFNESVNQISNDPKSPAKPTLEVLRTKVGFDPFKDLDQVIMGVRGPISNTAPQNSIVLLAQGNFKDGPAKIEKLRDWLGEDALTDIKTSQGMHPSGAKTVKITGKSQFNVKEVYELNFGFPNDTMMVFSASAALMNDTLDVIAGTIEGLCKDQAWLDALKRPNIGAAIWGVGNNPGDIAKQAGAPSTPEALRPVKQFFIDLNFTPDFAAHIGLVCDSIDSATKLADNLRQQYNQIKPMAAMVLASFPAPEMVKLVNDRINILNELEVVKITVTVPADDMRKLNEEAKRMAEKMQAAQKGKGGASALPFPGLPGTPDKP